MEIQELIAVLHTETEPSTGCTDPGSISLAVANAAAALGRFPERIEVLLSPDVYKNAVSVGIPGSYQSGVELAAMLGALIPEPEKGLAILAEVTEELLERAKQEVKRGRIRVTYGQTPDPLYVRADVFAGQDSASAVIEYDYSQVVEVSKNGVQLRRPDARKNQKSYPLLGHSVKELYDLILTADPECFAFLLEYAQQNLEAARRDIDSPRMRMGRLIEQRNPTGRRDVFDVINRAQANTAAAGEARMKGMNVTIMTIAGSGNHGITNFLGVLSAAQALGATRQQTEQALAISSMITVYIKGHVKRMTAFCGCGVAAATGVAAAMVYLLGGDYQRSVNAMQSVIGTLGGMFCDGAKESCAYKLSTAVSMAIQFAYLAMEECYIAPRVGIIGPTIEKTFENMGRLNDPGMLETDRMIVSIIRENQEQA